MITLLLAALGIFSVAFLPHLPTLDSLFPILLLSVFLLLRKKYTSAALLIGIGYGLIYGHSLIAKQLPHDLEAQTFWVNVKVVGLPKLNHQRQRFTARIQSIELKNNGLKNNEMKEKDLSFLIDQKISLSYYFSFARFNALNKDNAKYKSQPISKSSSKKIVQPGDTWRLLVKLKRPRGFVNPAGFDYQLYLLQQGLVASGYVKNHKDNQLIARECPLINIHCVRFKLSESVKKYLKEHSHHGTLLGLIVGNRDSITEEQWQLLRNTGTIHLMAISGLHVGLAALMGLLFGKLLMRFCGLLFFKNIDILRYSRFLPTVFSITFSFFYSLLAGFSLPTQRATIMILAVQIFFLLNRKINPWLIVSIALLGIAMLDPLASMSQGFWLSFLAVAILMFTGIGYQNRDSQVIFRSLNKGLAFIKMQWFLVVGLAIPGIVLVQGFSLSSPVSNLVAIPWVSIFTVPFSFLGLISWFFNEQLGIWFFRVAIESLNYLWLMLEQSEYYFGGFFDYDFKHVSLMYLLLAFVGIVWCYLPRGIPFRWLGLLCLLPLLFASNNKFDLRINFLDVGQGTAVVVETPNHQMVYDVGRRYSDQFDVGQHIVAPYLIQQGYKAIDRLMVSHSDHDHSGGMQGLLSLINVKHIFSGEAKQTGGQQCLAGQQWHWDDVEFSVIWPTKDYIDSAIDESSNNRSCVLLIRYGHNHILLAGDIEKSVERKLLAKHNLPESISVLLVPHHGSRSSSHLNWVTHLQPDYAVVTAGYLNAYHHPNKKVVQRYQAYASHYLNTAYSGAIRFTFSQTQKVKVDEWRYDFSRYWY
jgi:competence protein ComEC